MAHDVTGQIRQLETERQRLEGLLARYPVWRALRQLDAAERLASDRASRDPASLARLARERADLEAQLSGNAVFEAHRSVVAALRAMAPRNDETGASPAAQQNVPVVDKSTPAARPGEPAPERPVELIAVARTSRTPASGVIRTATIHPALPGSEQTPRRMPAGPDDLTRIRRIDRALATALVARGVRTYEQIASFGSADVKTLAAALGLGRRISQENWIEQAAVLAARQAAAASPSTQAAPAAGPTTPDVPVQVASIIASHPADRPTAQSAASPPAPVAAVGLVARAIAARVLSGQTSKTTVVSSREPVPARVAAVEADAAVMPAARVAMTPAVSLVSSAARRIAGTLDARKAGATPLPATEPVIPVVPPTAPEPDDLTRIAGIDDTLAASLSAAGFTTYASLAGATRADTARITAVLADRPVSALGVWIEQAAMLMRGDLPVRAGQQARGEFDCLVPRPAEAVMRDEVFAAWLAEHSRSFAAIEDTAEPQVEAEAPSVPAEAATTIEPFGEAVADVSAGPALGATDPAPVPPVVAQPVATAEPKETTADVAQPDIDADDAVPPFVAAPALSISDRITAIERDIATLDFRPKPTAVRATLTPRATVPGAAAAHAEPFAPARDVEANVEIVRNEPGETHLPGAALGPGGEGQSIEYAAEDFDASTYAGYMERIEEASVDIVVSDPAAETRPAGSAGKPGADAATHDGRTVRRFLKALTGN